MKASVNLHVQKHETFSFRSHQSLPPNFGRHFPCPNHQGKNICPRLHVTFCRVQGRRLTAGRLQSSPTGFLRICYFTLHFESEQNGEKWIGGGGRFINEI